MVRSWSNSSGLSAKSSGLQLSGCRPAAEVGFSLIELLVVIAIIALLAALLFPTLSRTQESARATQCLNQLRQIGMAVRHYADENEDLFPRSQHSAFTHGQLPWERSLASHLGSTSTAWTNLLTGIYHCPSDKRSKPWSYGLNVYYELGPDDDYLGKPLTWRRLAQLPHPSATLLFAENTSSADHLMPHFWFAQSDAADLASHRHHGRANYTFADGHAHLLPLNSIFSPPSLDLWNPTLAQ